jgi:hypothetical protein
METKVSPERGTHILAKTFVNGPEKSLAARNIDCPDSRKWAISLGI